MDLKNNSITPGFLMKFWEDKFTKMTKKIKVDLFDVLTFMEPDRLERSVWIPTGEEAKRIDLYNEIVGLFPSKYDVLLKIEKKLLQVDKNNLKKYDLEYAKNHIRFYMNNKIPHFDLEEPDGVHGTEYNVVLENEEYLDNNYYLDIQVFDT